MTYQQALRSNIAAEMGRRNFTQAAVSAGLGLSPSAFSARLNGHTDFRVSELVHLAMLLGVPISTLVAGMDEEVHAMAGQS